MDLFQTLIDLILKQGGKIVDWILDLVGGGGNENPDPIELAKALVAHTINQGLPKGLAEHVIVAILAAYNNLPPEKRDQSFIGREINLAVMQFQSGQVLTIFNLLKPKEPEPETPTGEGEIDWDNVPEVGEKVSSSIGPFGPFSGRFSYPDDKQEEDEK